MPRDNYIRTNLFKIFLGFYKLLYIPVLLVQLSDEKHEETCPQALQTYPWPLAEYHHNFQVPSIPRSEYKDIIDNCLALV